MFSMLREAPLPDGKPGPLSFRRCAAALLIPAAVALFGLGLEAARTLPPGVPGWIVIVPGALCLGSAILMPILTTIEGVVQIIQAVRGAVTGKSP
jgi:hypothetical protein